MSHDFPPPDYQKPSYDYAPPPPEKKGRGCFFWGCIISLILFVVLVLVIIGSIYALYRYGVNMAKEYTDTAPMPMPAVAMPEPERVALHDRVKAFGEAMQARKATEPLVLTAEDINALIDDDPRFKGRANVTIEGDEIKGKISFPVGDVVNIAELKGRYFNGSATLRVAIMNGILEVRAENIELKGKPLTGPVADSMARENLAKGVMDDPKMRESIDKIESLVVKDGKVIITPRAPAKAADTPPADAKDGDAKDAPPKEEAPKDAPTKEEAPKDAPTDAPQVPKAA